MSFHAARRHLVARPRWPNQVSQGHFLAVALGQRRWIARSTLCFNERKGTRTGKDGHIAKSREKIVISEPEFRQKWEKIFENRKMLDFIAEEASAWLNANGATMYINSGDQTVLAHAPISLFPAPIPEKFYFDLGKSITSPLNTLMDKVSQDTDFLRSELAGSAQADPQFTGKLLGLLEKLRQEGSAACPHRLAIHRNDFMIQPGVGPLMVEFNTIAASFGSLANRVSQLHRFLFGRFAKEINKNSPNATRMGRVTVDPLCSSIQGITNLLQQGMELFGGKEKRAAVLMVVQPGEKNSADQRILEHTLWTRHGIPVIRKTLAEIETEGILRGSQQDLVVEQRTIGVVYYRAGYTPKDYPTDTEWDSVLKIERSSAIKCPSVAYHLAGSKRIQQALSTPGTLRRFLDEDEAMKVSKCFTKMTALDPVSLADHTVQEMVEAAKQDPSKFVLKPQREGGGNNLWGEQITSTLRAGKGLEAFVLMERIMPQSYASALLRNKQLTVGPCLSELGIYGGFLYDGQQNTVLKNGKLGHLVRTKQLGVDEGGVATGYSCIDSPFLVNFTE